MSVVRDLILQADDDLRYPTSGELRTMVDFLDQGAMRVSVVKILTDNEKKIVDESARQLFGRKPEYVAPGGNAYTSRRMAACLRDMEIILRYVTYSVFTGDASVMEDRCLNGLRETYLALGTPGASVAAGVNLMKEAALAIVNDKDGITSGDCASLNSEIGTYFDRAAASVA